jgi:hypothetical protein
LLWVGFLNIALLLLDYTDQPDLTLSLHKTNIRAKIFAKYGFVQFAGFNEPFAKMTVS